ncbi:uncharacterized protein LOC131307111 [Rhododendron vialii]|uniref:uncharacterized protein LOC131307111 n=1 Tax=Rhododendron vialii TaxID=182163 RepID=UPI00265E3711|nr:uncharacterized protein LOC131307111 [Rhododendron vialii]
MSHNSNTDVTLYLFDNSTTRLINKGHQKPERRFIAFCNPHLHRSFVGIRWCSSFWKNILFEKEDKSNQTCASELCPLEKEKGILLLHKENYNAPLSRRSSQSLQVLNLTARLDAGKEFGWWGTFLCYFLCSYRQSPRGREKENGGSSSSSNSSRRRRRRRRRRRENGYDTLPLSDPSSNQAAVDNLAHSRGTSIVMEMTSGENTEQPYARSLGYLKFLKTNRTHQPLALFATWKTQVCITFYYSRVFCFVAILREDIF